MKFRKRNILLVLSVVVVALAAHYVTVALGGPPAELKRQGAKGPLTRWLDLSGEPAEAVAKEETSFRRDMRRLERQVQIETLKLANLFEADETTDDQLKAQFDAVSKAQVAVHQRIAAHLLAIRPYLDADQRARFNGLLAQHFRGPGGPEGKGRPGMHGPGGPGMKGHHGRDGRGPGGQGMHGRPGPDMQDPGMPGGGPRGMHGPRGGPGMMGPAEGMGPGGPMGPPEGMGPGGPAMLGPPRRGLGVPGMEDRPRGGPDDRGMRRGPGQFRRGPQQGPPRPIDDEQPEPPTESETI
jgi:hypothetical protein